MTDLTPVLSATWGLERSWNLDTYAANGGYEGATKAFTMDPADIIQAVKDSGLRGRGGAGFPTGMKWGFLPAPDGGPRYLVVNADESEPGTCKDIPTMMASPHALDRGHDHHRRSRSAATTRSSTCAARWCTSTAACMKAVQEANDNGWLGKNIQGTGFNLDITVHAGAGAYICGEETALLDSLEGRRGQPRLKPPFPAVAGLYARPTVVNNVESIASRAVDHRATASTGSRRWAPRRARAWASSRCRAT